MLGEQILARTKFINCQLVCGLIAKLGTPLNYVYLYIDLLDDVPLQFNLHELQYESLPLPHYIQCFDQLVPCSPLLYWPGPCCLYLDPL